MLRILTSTIIIWFLLSQFFILNLSAQNDYFQQLEYASNLFESELYFEAVTEFKRLLFFDKSNEYSFDANYKIALSYKYGALFDNAINYFNKAERISRTDDEIYECKTQIIRCNILRGTTDNALILLKELEENIKFRSKIDNINYWRGWAHMLSDDWENAANSFSKIEYFHPLKIFAQQVEDEKYSVTFAKVISYILPGFGQFYTGYYLSGLLSLGWNVLFGYLTINSFVENRAFDGLVIGNLLWLRFYRGNIQNSEKFAVLENIKIANKAYKYLENNFTGEKP